MSRIESPDTSGTIRISKAEATSTHVDDLLKRQMSLRGESGITRDRGRRWYYQSWFYLALAGMLFALLGWAIIEPFFNDMLNVQGALTAVDDTPSVQNLMIHDGAVHSIGMAGSVTVNKTIIYLPPGSRMIQPDGKYSRLDMSQLHVGDHVRFYCEAGADGERRVGVAEFAKLGVDPAKDTGEDTSIEQMQSHQTAIGLLIFPILAALIGIGVGTADGIMCRLPRRVIFVAVIALLVGFIGGFISNILANLIYAPLSHLAESKAGPGVSSLGTMGFLIQMSGRGLAWALAGSAMGLAQGMALRSSRLILYGLLGGIIGGLLGGLLFDPIDLLILGQNRTSAYWSRLIGFMVIGCSVGAMMGIVELLARDAWLRMLAGPLAGKEFLIFKDTMRIGSSPKSDIYLFNDTAVAGQHAILRGTGDTYEIENKSKENPVTVNGRAVTTSRLRHGDQIGLGRTVFVFQRQKG